MRGPGGPGPVRVLVPRDGVVWKEADSTSTSPSPSTSMPTRTMATHSPVVIVWWSRCPRPRPRSYQAMVSSSAEADSTSTSPSPSTPIPNTEDAPSALIVIVVFQLSSRCLRSRTTQWCRQCRGRQHINAAITIHVDPEHRPCTVRTCSDRVRGPGISGLARAFVPGDGITRGRQHQRRHHHHVDPKHRECTIRTSGNRVRGPADCVWCRLRRWHGCGRRNR